MELKTAVEVFLLTVVFVQRSMGQNYTFITTENGIIRGKVRHVNVDFLPEQQTGIFLGIPYAKPPIGDLRFLKPEPPDPFKGTFEADEMPPACIQYSQYPFPWYDSLPGKSEDCLYLNVGTPINTSIKRPVKFYIHGGGFSAGSNRMGFYKGEDEASDYADTVGFQSHVVVTINYRLGALGFLTTGTEDAPGNVGMYDMVMALNWVRQNIASFNGDPDNITLMGQGAGAIAASLFCTSPETKPLFKRVILDGGTFLSILKNKYEDNLALTNRLAKAVLCDIESPKEMVECLRTKDAALLAEVLSSFDPTSHFQFYPQYEKDDLFPFDPKEALKSNFFADVDVFLSYTREEGSYLLTTMESETFGVFGEKDAGVNKTYAKAVLTKYLKEYPDAGLLADRLLEDNGKTSDFRRKLFTAMGDERVVCPVLYFSELYSYYDTNNVYILEKTTSPAYNPWAAWMGSVHFSNVQDEFYQASGLLDVNSVVYNFTDTTMLFNFFMKTAQNFFVYTGDPGSVKFSRSNPRYDYINSSEIRSIPGSDTADLFPLHEMLNPGGLNCEVFRPLLNIQPYY